ncbi:TetR/AcrR family transcriptional regulator [Actinomadura madurae]|uniref:TetR/AcrR family transcriptional regulator n=1 Tax=Actinomadura madurae TaxID=1993 RepID=UPI0020D211AD|nr:TetR/AcrR family transcriptional regulator [Actinomadura madurae]MCQ0015284.1 TetR/AcrR family transcriptional regulator [Actinomadura madurae]
MKDTDPDGPRDRILAATAKLLAEGGREAVSTRAVSAAAGVQAPTLYRLFGDKQGLLDAVAAEGFAAYLDSKTVQEPTGDPVDVLRAGWDLHIEFGLANPALYLVMYEPRPGAVPRPPSRASRSSPGTSAASPRRAACASPRNAPSTSSTPPGSGTTVALIAMPPDRRDLGLSTLAREAVIAAITTDTPAAPTPGPAAAATALRAHLPQTTALTEGEKTLLKEWLTRLATQ